MKPIVRKLRRRSPRPWIVFDDTAFWTIAGEPMPAQSFCTWAEAMTYAASAPHVTEATA